MANTKKAENIEETVENVEVNTVKKGDNTVEELKRENEELKKNFEELKNMFSEFVKTKNSTIAPTAQYVQPSNTLNDEVKIIHLVDRANGLKTYMHISNLEIEMAAFGEERTLDKRQAEELAGKYRHFFEMGIIAFGEGCEDIAKRFSLKSYKDYEKVIGTDFLYRLATYNVYQLEELYNKLCEGHKAFVIEYFKRKIIEGDKRFNDTGKIEMLNRVSDGAMEGTILDKQTKKI